MNIDEYQKRVRALFTRHDITEEQWAEMTKAVLDASESGNTPHIDQIMDNEYFSQHGWYCERCRQVVAGEEVTFSEHHEKCGGRCS